MEMSVDQLVSQYTPEKDDLQLKHKNLNREGIELVERLNQPILMEQG